MKGGLVGARPRPGVAAALIAILALAVFLAGSDASAGSAPSAYPFQRFDQPKLDSQLGQIARTQSAKGSAAALGLARSAGLAGRTGTVRVIVASRPGDSATARTSVTAAGGTVVGSAGTLIEALVPPSALDKLAANAAVADVRPPLPHAATAVDEAVHLTDADTWHTAGYGGAGVKIAIIDLGFYGYSGLLGTALPSSVTAIDHCSGNLAAAPPVGTEHGTAVAELVHQMAPSAQLYLICVDSEVGLAQAEQDAINDGVKIVNHSVAWFNTSRGDGTGAAGTPDAIVADARVHGILWVNAAGNYGFDHWAGSFEPDSSNPNLNDFASGVDHDDVVIDAGETGCAFLKWDDWPVTSEDFDLGLVRVSDGTLVASSANDQADGPSAPVEQLCYTNPGASPATYSLEISQYSVADDPQLDLYYVGDNPLAYATTESVSEPASSPAALAVGAACWQTGQLEDYSSLGPTIDGRPKPDLTAPDSVSTVTYGPAVSGSAGCGASGFAGTSAAAPQVAGAAALLLQQQPSLTVGELTAALEERAEANQSTEAGGPTEDAETGHGPLALGLVNPLGGLIAFDFGGSTSLTDGAAVQRFAGASPSWSTDGTMFLSSGTNTGITLSTGDGDSVSSVPGTGGDAEPSYSPIGNELVAYQLSPSAIVKVNIFSGLATTLLSSPDPYPDPQWAPDNSKIAYLQTTAGTTDVWTMNTSGSGQTQLTTVGTVAAPSIDGGAIAWSRDSSKLAFVVGPAPYAIWVVNANGTGAHAITTPSSSPLFSAFGPSWSPDGSQIAFIKNGTTLELMNADGSNIHPLNPHETFSSASLRTTAWTSNTTEYPEFPVDTTAVITGEPLVGSPLQAAIKGWVAASSETFDYSWLRCKPFNLCNVIAGATDSTYTVTSADLGYQIVVEINATPHPTPSFRAIFSADTDVVEPALPVASTLPTFSGTAAVGSTLNVNSNGSWSGSPTSFSYSWEDCGSDGGECSPIGFGGSSYTVTGADAGSTIRVAVIGTNGGGSNVVSSAASAVVPGGGGSGGGGGGGGGGGAIPDLAVALSGPAQVAVGGQASFSLAVSDVNGATASGIHLLVTLPPGATVDATSSDRGPGCTPASGTVDCNLDFLSGTLVAHVTIVLALPTAGAATLTATVKDSQGDSSTANNTASATVEVGSPVTTVTTTTTFQPPPTRKPASADHINGNAKVNHLTGTSTSDVINAGAGNDWVNGGAGNDVINGGPGNDTLYGGSGNDTITGGPGADRIFGGPGNDTIHAVDGVKDTIDCGTGHDVVYADRHDKVAENCEVVHRS